jgi:lipopolysaccharide transport system permease protein
MFAMLRAAWRYRYFIASSIRAEIRARFARSKLGGLWMVLHPLSQVLIFAFVLSSVLSSRLPGTTNRYGYSIYLIAGVLAWSLFFEIVTRCLTVFIDNGQVLKKITFPRIALPLIAIGGALISNLLLLVASLAIFVVLGHLPGAAIAWLPLLLIVNVALAAGTGLTLGVLNVFLRDVGQVVPVVLQFVYWFTPIVYTVSLLPAEYRRWLAFNPLYAVVTGYQNALLFDQPPPLGPLLGTAVLAMVLLGASLLLFRKASAEIIDLL